MEVLYSHRGRGASMGDSDDDTRLHADHRPYDSDFSQSATAAKETPAADIPLASAPAPPLPPQLLASIASLQEWLNDPDRKTRMKRRSRRRCDRVAT